MKANVLHGTGDLRFEEVLLPPCSPGWALVRVRAAGICSSDVGRILVKGTYHFPMVPGHEFSGTVSAVGDEKDAIWLNRRVGAFPLIPCGKCPQCLKKRYEICEHYDYIGSRRDGAFAEYVAVPVWNLVELPDHVPFETGAMLEPLCVGLHAVRLAGGLAGRRVAVIGTGVIGICAAFWAHYLGSKEVRVIGRGEQKRAMVEQFPGLRYCGDAEEIIGSHMDVVIEAVGSADALRAALRLAAPETHVVMVGNPAGAMELSQDEYWMILRKQLILHGSWNSSFRGQETSEWTEAVRVLDPKVFPVEKLITHRIRPHQLLAAVRFMASHESPYCKVMMIWDEEKIQE